jgi:hypothetical protein
VSVKVAGEPVGTLAYAALPSPITFNANTTYYVISQETYGGDQSYNADTFSQTSADGVLSGGVHGSESYHAMLGIPGYLYGPVDFRYTVAPK